MLLEIEQKFSFTLANAALLRRNGGSPPFKNMRDFRKEDFYDTYYDSGNKLSTAGIWLRKRQHYYAYTRHQLGYPSIGEWEVKQRKHGGSFSRSTFRETKDPSEILELVRSHFPRPGLTDGFGLDAIAAFPDGFGLYAIAAFRTSRETMLADGKFTVVMDETNFGHRVGEVEVMAEDAEQGHKDIETFMTSPTYSWFFDTENPKGKLTAYFEKFGYSESET